MRVIAGKHKNRNLYSLEGMNTRPMMSRMKESIFNILGQFFDGEVVLDLFGGSGQLSIEALSRGCSFSYIVEKNYEAMKVIKANIDLVKENDSCQILNMDYKVALNKFKDSNMKFDIIFLDPPYRMNIVSELLDFIYNNDLLNDNGYIVCQYVTGNYKPVDINYLKVIKNYVYASSEVCIYKKERNE